MALDDISPSISSVAQTQPTILPPLRIILHVRPDIRRNSENKLKENSQTVVTAFFDHTTQHLNHENAYIHFPSAGDCWQSQVIVDYCTGDVSEGSVANNVPLLIYIVTQTQDGLVFEKARTSSLMEEYTHSDTDRLPWKAKEFLKVPQDIKTRKENELQTRILLEQDRRRQMWGKRQLDLESDVEAIIRRNLEGNKITTETTAHSTITTIPPLLHLSGHPSLSQLPIRLRDRPVRVLLQIAVDWDPRDIQEQAIITSTTFLRLMMGDQYHKTKVYRHIRAMNMEVDNDLQLWILVDCWVGRLTRMENPPFLTMIYWGNMHDGLMKFQPTKLSNAGKQAACSRFLAKFPLGRKGSSMTIEGLEPTGSDQCSNEGSPVLPISSDAAHTSQARPSPRELVGKNVSGD